MQIWLDDLTVCYFVADLTINVSRTRSLSIGSQGDVRESEGFQNMPNRRWRIKKVKSCPCSSKNIELREKKEDVREMDGGRLGTYCEGAYTKCLNMSVFNISELISDLHIQNV